ncbi:MAG TPA: creatininase family protein [Anaerovoracaceae bacterium]|nr:creatininase family protein [Anaerovoracaceae bacterium]
MSKTLLAEMTWEEAEEALKKCEVVVIPTGSVEQHGKALPVGTDWMVADTLGKELAKKVGENVVVLPCSCFGYSDYHSDFAGTLSLREETLIAVLNDILDYVLRWGVKKVMFVNSHGANMGAIKNVSHKLRAMNVLVSTAMWWDVAVAINPGWGLIGHADINETSFIMAIRPDLVKPEKFQNPEQSNLGENIKIKNLYQVDYKGANITMGLRTKDVTNFGCMLEVGFEGGAAVAMNGVENSSAERGLAMIAGVTDFIAEFIEDFKKVEVFKVGFPYDQYMTRK